MVYILIVYFNTLECVNKHQVALKLRTNNIPFSRSLIATLNITNRAF